MGKEIGIDLGTTNTVVSYVNKNGRIRALRYDKSEIIPSVLYFRAPDEYFIGDTAKKLLTQNPAAGIANFKTSIGDSQRHEIVAENGEIISLRSRDAAKLFLNKIVQGIESKLVKEFGAATGCIDRAVVTVPANFSSTEKSAVKNAANDAGLENIKLAAEPTAAAVAYENSKGDDTDEIILVYDFGGGTFDVSVIQKVHGAFEEITTGGDKH
ncbi:MAG: Hsp70 family protein, partial [Selenomonadaceae bacterium]|nr:Hsp70 family protein [Selenomonadaceae bacterium]